MITNKEYEKIVETYSSGNKLEVCFQNTNINIYNRILNDLEKISDSNEKIETVDYIYKIKGLQERVTSIFSKENDKMIQYSVNKNKKIFFKNEDYDFKTVLSSENKVLFEKKKASPFLIRNKQRNKFFFFKNILCVNLTIVTSTENESEPKTTYEIECVLLKFDPKNVKIFFRFIEVKLLPIIQNTVEIYTSNERNNLINSFNSLMGLKKSYKLQHENIMTARNLKLADLTYGGLIGGNINYNISPKAEGHRKLLVIVESGIWLVYPPFEISCLVKNVSELKDLNIFGSIFDGENIQYERRINEGLNNKSKYYYLPFDTIIYNGDINTKNKYFTDRYKYTENLKLIFEGSDIIYIDVIPFMNLGKTQEELEKNFKKMEEIIPSLPYLTDGFMLRPIEYEYKNNYIDLKDRILNKHPDICKLKDWKDLTIDLKYINQINDTKPGILMVSGPEGLIEFNDIPIENIDYDSIEEKKIESNQIIEFGPKMVGEKILMYPIRIRDDKIKPNREDIAKNIWNDINHPLNFDILRGDTYPLLEQYFNKILTKNGEINIYKKEKITLEEIKNKEINVNISIELSYYFKSEKNLLWLKEKVEEILKFYEKSNVKFNFLKLDEKVENPYTINRKINGNNKEISFYYGKIEDIFPGLELSLKPANQELFLSNEDFKLSEKFFYGFIKKMSNEIIKDEEINLVKSYKKDKEKYMSPIEVEVFDSIAIGDDMINEMSSNLQKKDSIIRIPSSKGKYCRVSCIQDNNSFLHALLKAMNKKYNSFNTFDRIQMAKELRTELTEHIKNEMDEDDDFKKVFEGLKSEKKLNENYYSFLSELLKININIYNFKDDEFVLINNFIYEKEDEDEENRITICLLRCKESSFEPIGFIAKTKREKDSYIYFNFQSEE